jgi:hypothetical protein
MFRSRGENLRSVYILLFLNIAFFLLEHQDAAKYAALFAFDGEAVAAGQLWRLFTWQFTQAGSGMFEALWLFVTLLLLYMMGAAVEEEWGTLHFVTLFGISTITSCGVAAWFGVPLLGTYFVTFTLLYIYASTFPHQTFYFFGAIPVPVRLLAILSLAYLVYGVFAGSPSNLAALAGAMAGYVYFLTQRIPVSVIIARAEAELGRPGERVDPMSMQNAARYAALRLALTSGSSDERARVAAQCERDIVPNVNICPPADFKPENTDGYCIRCEGFAECSARLLRATV